MRNLFIILFGALFMSSGLYGVDTNPGKLGEQGQGSSIANCVAAKIQIPDMKNAQHGKVRNGDFGYYVAADVLLQSNKDRGHVQAGFLHLYQHTGVYQDYADFALNNRDDNSLIGVQPVSYCGHALDITEANAYDGTDEDATPSSDAINEANVDMKNRHDDKDPFLDAWSSTDNDDCISPARAITIFYKTAELSDDAGSFEDVDRDLDAATDAYDQCSPTNATTYADHTGICDQYPSEWAVFRVDQMTDSPVINDDSDPAYDNDTGITNTEQLENKSFAGSNTTDNIVATRNQFYFSTDQSERMKNVSGEGNWQGNGTFSAHCFNNVTEDQQTVDNTTGENTGSSKQTELGHGTNGIDAPCYEKFFQGTDGDQAQDCNAERQAGLGKECADGGTKTVNILGDTTEKCTGALNNTPTGSENVGTKAIDDRISIDDFPNEPET